MDQKDKDFFKKVFEDLDSGPGEKHFGPEKLDVLMRHMVTYFDRMRDKLDTGTEEERAEILNSFMEAKSEVDAYMKRLQEKTGLSADELSELVNDRESFTDDSWETIQSRKEDLKTIAGEIIDKNREQVQKSKPQGITKKPAAKKGKRKKPHEKWMKS